MNLYHLFFHYGFVQVDFIFVLRINYHNIYDSTVWFFFPFWGFRGHFPSMTVPCLGLSRVICPVQVFQFFFSSILSLIQMFTVQGRQKPFPPIQRFPILGFSCHFPSANVLSSGHMSKTVFSTLAFQSSMLLKQIAPFSGHGMLRSHCFLFFHLLFSILKFLVFLST